MASPKKAVKQMRDDVVKSAPRETLEELFQDFYNHRYQLYAMNLFRGIFFGFGTVVGGTLVVALLLWLLSLFNEVPFLGQFVEMIQRSIEATRH
jgi:hypothetical protein